MLAELKNESRVAGAKQVMRAVTAGRARQVFLARDADPTVTAPISALCGQKGVGVQWVESMRLLGSACGLPIGCAAASII